MEGEFVIIACSDYLRICTRPAIAMLILNQILYINRDDHAILLRNVIFFPSNLTLVEETNPVYTRRSLTVK